MVVCLLALEIPRNAGRVHGDEDSSVATILASVGYRLQFVHIESDGYSQSVLRFATIRCGTISSTGAMTGDLSEHFTAAWAA